jgi:hypothetical protein
MKYRLLFFAILLAKIGFAQDSVVLSIEDAIVASQQKEEQSVEMNTHGIVSPKIISEKAGYVSEPITGQRFDRIKWKEIIGNTDYSEAESERKKKSPQNQDSTQIDTAKRQKSKKRIERMERESDIESEQTEPKPVVSYLMASILKFVMYAVVIGIISYILFIIFQNVSIKSRGKKIRADETFDPSAIIEDIQELEINRLLREAKVSGNYRLVIRLSFLGLLKKLDEKGHILWKRDKTNRDYLTELLSKKYYFDEIKNLTQVYEHVWYGDHVYPVHMYEKIISSFKLVDEKLNDSKAL